MVLVGCVRLYVEFWWDEYDEYLCFVGDGEGEWGGGYDGYDGRYIYDIKSRRGDFCFGFFFERGGGGKGG